MDERYSHVQEFSHAFAHGPMHSEVQHHLHPQGFLMLGAQMLCNATFWLRLAHILNFDEF